MLSCVSGFVDVVFLISFLSKFQSINLQNRGLEQKPLF